MDVGAKLTVSSVHFLKVVGYSHNICASVTPVGISLQISHYRSVQGSCSIGSQLVPVWFLHVQVCHVVLNNRGP